MSNILQSGPGHQLQVGAHNSICDHLWGLSPQSNPFVFLPIIGVIPCLCLPETEKKKAPENQRLGDDDFFLLGQTTYVSGAFAASFKEGNSFFNLYITSVAHV